MREDRHAPVRRRDRRPDDARDLVVAEQRALAGRAAGHERVDPGVDQEVDVRAQRARVRCAAVVVRGEQGDDDGGPGKFHRPEASGPVREHCTAFAGNIQRDPRRLPHRTHGRIHQITRTRAGDSAVLRAARTPR